MEMKKSSKAVAMVTTALLIGSQFWLMNTKRINSSLEAGLQKERLKTEELLSEKLLLEKDIQKMKDQLSTLNSQNGALDKLVKFTADKLKAREDEYNRLKKSATSITQLKKERAELHAIRNQLENELQSMRVSYAALEAKNNDLSNTVVSLQERNRLLTDDLNKMMLASVDHTYIQATRKNVERLTVRAKRAKKLVADFEVASEFKNLSFRILDPQQNVISQQQGAIAFTTLSSEKNFTASTVTSDAKKLQRVEVVYTPKEKMKAGTYTLEVLNDNLYVGSLSLKLR